MGFLTSVKSLAFSGLRLQQYRNISVLDISALGPHIQEVLHRLQSCRSAHSEGSNNSQAALQRDTGCGWLSLMSLLGQYIFESWVRAYRTFLLDHCVQLRVPLGLDDEYSSVLKPIGEPYSKQSGTVDQALWQHSSMLYFDVILAIKMCVAKRES